MVSTILSRPRTPSGASKASQPRPAYPAPPPPPMPSAAVIYAHEPQPPPQPKEKERRSSLGFLRRTKSTELSKSGRKQALLREQERLRQQQAEAVPQLPPSLPHFAPPAKLHTFGGDTTMDSATAFRPDSIAIVSGRVSTSTQYNPGRVSIDPEAPPRTHYPAPKMSMANGTVADPYARTESMTHRGRASYASSALSVGTINSPRRVRRRKDPTPFNILIIGAQNSGKTSFLDLLKSALALSPKKRKTGHTSDADDMFAGPKSTSQGGFTSHYLETEIDGERIGLTLWDSEGLEKNVVDLQMRDMSAFVESKFEETFNEEMKVVRSPGVQDTHIHCTFLLLDPARLDKNIATVRARGTNSNGRVGNHATGKYGAAGAPRIIGGLDEDLDLQVLKTLQGKTTVVPIISKADSITTAHMAHLKRTVWDSLKKANLDPLEALGLDDDGDMRDDKIDEEDEDDSASEADELHSTPGVGTAIPMSSPDTSESPESKRSKESANMNSSMLSKSSTAQQMTSSSETKPYLPLSIISPDLYEPDVVGRRFPWGFADPYDSEHCDFTRLKDAVFKEWRGELREASRELWYEGWRTSRLKPRTGRR